MTLAALVDAGANLEQIQAGIDSLGLPDCRLVASEVKRHGFRARQIRVEHSPEHAPSTPAPHHGHDRSQHADRSSKRSCPADLHPPGRSRGQGPRHAASAAFTSTRSERSIRSPISSARPSAGICWASTVSKLRRCQPVGERSRLPTVGSNIPGSGHRRIAARRADCRVARQCRADHADRCRHSDHPGHEPTARCRR